MGYQRLTSDDVLKIKKLLWDGSTLRDIANGFGMSIGAIQAISNGLNHSKVPWPDGSLGPFPTYQKDIIRVGRFGHKAEKKAARAYDEQKRAARDVGNRQFQDIQMGAKLMGLGPRATIERAQKLAEERCELWTGPSPEEAEAGEAAREALTQDD